MHLALECKTRRSKVQVFAPPNARYVKCSVTVEYTTDVEPSRTSEEQLTGPGGRGVEEEEKGLLPITVLYFCEQE